MFEKEAEEYVKAFTDRSQIWSNDKLMQLQLREAYKDGAELGCKKANEELEEKISVLLSCKDCPENKDGLICQKEYENKCLAQKIQFIKELQQENAELKELVKTSYEVYNDDLDYSYRIEGQLTKAKEIIEELYNIVQHHAAVWEPMEHARKFMTEE